MHAPMQRRGHAWPTARCMSGPGHGGRFVENRARTAGVPGGHPGTAATRPLAWPWLTPSGTPPRGYAEGHLKSQRAEKQGHKKQASRPGREPGRPQPDQRAAASSIASRIRRSAARRSTSAGATRKRATGSYRAVARSMREEYEIWFLLMWLLGVPSIVVLSWSLVSG